MEIANFLKVVLFFMFINLVFPNKVYAYLDPGSSSYFIQILIAVLVGSFFAIKTFWIKVINLIKRMFAFKLRINDKKN